LDLTRLKGKGSPNRFNPKLTDKNGHSFHPADNICAFIERLPHVKGLLSALYILALRDRVFRARWINSVVLMSLKRRFDKGSSVRKNYF
jgi:predicted DCC family thiol-disulfide oxidoreductase YuxK